MCVAPDARYIAIATSFGSNEGTFSDEQGARNARPLLVVFNCQLAMHVVLVCPKSSERGEYDAVLEVGSTDADTGKKLRSYDSHGLW